MRNRRVLALLVVLLFSATSAMAGGFRIPEAGAKAMGMGFAFTAQADDPSAIYFNPAGIVQLEGDNLKVGMTYIKANGASFSGITPLTGPVSRSETQKDLNFFVPNMFITRKASPNFAYGVGIFSPFGLGQEYENRNTSIFRSQITKIDLKTLVVNPTVAYKVNDLLSIGAGIDFMYGKAKLSRTPVGIDSATGFPANLYNGDLDGDGTAWGFNLGMLVTPNKQLKIGVAFRSKFDLDIDDGDVHLGSVFSGNINTPLGPLPPQGPAPIGFGGSTFNTKASTTVNIPATLDLGVAYIFDRLTLEVDASWTFWHSFKSLDIDNNDNRVFLPDTSSPKNWNDVVAIYVGGEYRVTDPLALRLGFRYDPTPVPPGTMGPELPDSNKLYYCAGAGYKVNQWTFDLAYMYMDKRDRTGNNLRTEGGIPVGFNGEWKGDAHLVAFDVGYNF
ncbi:MAG: OmpP1/FadL family transporter [Candidatus Deferrimicrobiaceae bacterium]